MTPLQKSNFMLIYGPLLLQGKEFNADFLTFLQCSQQFFGKFMSEGTL
jgi:hypothetical protein